jgi:hypothetical protein
MNRIRYRKLDETTQQSIQTFRHPTNGGQYIIRISPDMWRILDAETEVVAISGYNLKKHSNLIKIKEGLRTLGVELPTERRERKPKL